MPSSWLIGIISRSKSRTCAGRQPWYTENGCRPLSSAAVGLHDHPSRRVTDPEIQDFVLLDQRVEGLHQLRDLGGVVPAVKVELRGVSLQDGDCGVKFRSYQIDVVRLESLQA